MDWGYIDLWLQKQNTCVRASSVEVQLTKKTRGPKSWTCCVGRAREVDISKGYAHLTSDASKASVEALQGKGAGWV